MPVFNRQFFLPETLDSIASQTYTNWELVVVDDCSTDASVQVITDFAKAFPGKVTQLSSGKPQSGAATCRNIGIMHAQGELIIFLDSDDKLASYCLEQRAKVMEQASVDWAVFKQFVWAPGSDAHNVFNKETSNREEAIGYFLKMDPAWQTMAPIWRKKTLEILRGFDSELIYMEDPDIHLRALLKKNLNVKLAYQEPADCYYRIDNIDAVKLERFYDLSITSRFLFLNKIDEYLSEVDSSSVRKKYKHIIRDGYFLFLKVFLLSRLKKYNVQFIQTNQQLEQKGVLNTVDMLKIRLLACVFRTNNFLINTLRLRGLLYKLID